MSEAIAIVGMACRYPDADSPDELWGNALSQRSAFRRIPPERLNLADYWSDDPSVIDCTYVTQGAFLKNYTFDRVAFRVSGDAFRSADMTHWLALDVASAALADAGFAEAEGLNRRATGVFLGNTLTGEGSRASILRQRWPYVRRVISASLQAESWDETRLSAFLNRMEACYKHPFPEPGPESLVGGLANTIAGRICNYFNFKGTGYTVDGACASSLLAVMQACAALRDGDVDTAIAGGVDLSLDPFELVGFARVGALSKGPMKVYDRGSAGFLPGEGCGLAVLMRHADALAANRRIYALIRGAGMSSDGSGGMTRPEAEGQTLALERAYRRAHFDIGSVGYFEGHGTGTPVGDAVELRALSDARRQANASAPAAIGSIKANIGHTKAAAGAAGLIKASLAVWHGILPPTSGCSDPHEEITGERSMLRVLSQPEPWTASRSPRRAGVSSMGFGGINTHVVLEEASVSTERRWSGAGLESFAASRQDSELFVFAAADSIGLAAELSALRDEAQAMSISEMTDAAVALERAIRFAPYRAAVMASSPQQLSDRLQELIKAIDEGKTSHFDVKNGLFLGCRERRPRIGLLFPGQAAPVRRIPGALGKRFRTCNALYDSLNLTQGPDTATSVAQPAIVAASLSAIHALDELGIVANAAVGHSLGEISALCWAGAIEPAAAIRIATARGAAMMMCPHPGSMVTVGASASEIEPLLPEDSKLGIAAINGPRQTVFSGPTDEVNAFAETARQRGWTVSILPVSHAFHSVLMEDVSLLVQACLSGEQLAKVSRPVYSTVTGTRLAEDADLHALLVRQVTDRVEFERAVTSLAQDVDLLIEAGPGSILSNLATGFLSVPAVSIDAGVTHFDLCWR